MPLCENCGHHVSDRYVRVCVPDNEDGIQACPHCPDRLRAGGGGDWRYRKHIHTEEEQVEKQPS